MFLVRLLSALEVVFELCSDEIVINADCACSRSIDTDIFAVIECIDLREKKMCVMTRLFEEQKLISP